MVKLQIDLNEHIQGSLLSNIPNIEWVYAGPEGDKQMDPSINEDFSNNTITDFKVTPSSYKKGCLDIILTTNTNVKLKTIVAAAFDKSNYEKAMSLLEKYTNNKNVIIEFNGPGLVNIDQCILEFNLMAQKTSKEYNNLLVSFRLAKDNSLMLDDMHKINFFTDDNKSYFKLGNIPREIYTYKNDSSISVPRIIVKDYNVILCVDENNDKWINSKVDYNKIYELNQFGRSPLIKLQKKEEHDWVKAFSN
jgi:hypothetical protein